jgi:two-component system chemotaxis sensor kinase CheA
LSIYQKLLIVILLLVSSIVAMLAVYLPSRQLAAMERDLQAKTATYAHLVSKQVESAIAFNDQETAREVFESVAQDPEVDTLTLFNSRGEVLRARGSVSEELLGKRLGVGAEELIVTPARIAAIAPVVSLEGPRGTLVVELSRSGLDEQRRSVQRHAALVGLGALLFGALCASWIALSLGRRLRAIAAVADAVAAGDLDQKPVDATGSYDEIGRMAAAFNTMLERIRSLVEHIQRSAREERTRLESLVAARTRELDQRNQDMRRVLDNVEQGFLTLDLDAKMSQERSAILVRWLGRAPESNKFSDYIAQAVPVAGEWFALGWEGVIERLIPLEACLDQLPKRLRSGKHELSIEYRPVLGNAGVLERVLVVMTDVTAALERARAEADEREVTRLFTRVMADRGGFLQFFSEATLLVERVATAVETGELDELKRALHTLKGNTNIYGIDTVAGICHRFEDKLAESGRLSLDDVRELQGRWFDLSDKMQALIGDARAKIEIDDLEHGQILDAVAKGMARSEIVRRIQSWRLEPTQVHLARSAEQAQALAQRLGKGPVEVVIESNQLRLKAEDFGEFWAASVHVLRNAIDHGLETPEERAALGKPVPAKLSFATRLVDDRFMIEFSDDGRGITWSAVAARARALGHAASTPTELKDALFIDGLSTRSEATENSGRGVGLSAVRQACERLGGRVEVESRAGAGTTFRFVWPARLITEEPAESRLSIRHHPTSLHAAVAVGE